MTAEPATAAASLVWGAPFVGLLASIVVLPAVAPRLWHRHGGVVAMIWAALAAASLMQTLGAIAAARLLFNIVIAQYAPFMLALWALFTVAGGVVFQGELVGTPALNTGLLAAGALSASVLGTTGASMLLIRPLLRANTGRKFKSHTVIFFIFLVANIGGALSPLGDPPLFVGFLKGVDFFWPLRALWPATAFCVALLLAIFYVFDHVLARREGWRRTSCRLASLRIEGSLNLLLAGLAAVSVAIAGKWRPDVSFDLFGTNLGLQTIVLDLSLVAIAVASLALTDPAARAANGFEWEPLAEVAKLFFAIFICVEPIILMLKAGAEGPLAGLFTLLAAATGTAESQIYFWAAGLLSSVLDSAPTYLVFFQVAGGDPAQLTGPLASRLVALSLGAVYMGALTYIGNAPNLIVVSIARRAGTPMPSFLGYLPWSIGLLGPILILVSILFVR